MIINLIDGPFHGELMSVPEEIVRRGKVNLKEQPSITTYWPPSLKTNVYIYKNREYMGLNFYYDGEF